MEWQVLVDTAAETCAGRLRSERAAVLTGCTNANRAGKQRKCPRITVMRTKLPEMVQESRAILAASHSAHERLEAWTGYVVEALFRLEQYERLAAPRKQTSRRRRSGLGISGAEGGMTQPELPFAGAATQ